MSKVVVIDDFNQIKLSGKETDIITYKTSDTLSDVSHKNIRFLVINRYLKNFGIVQLVRLIKKDRNLKDVPIAIIYDWERKYEKLSLTPYNIDFFLTYNDIEKLEKIIKDSDFINDYETIESADDITLMNRLVFNHKTRENIINRYILNSALKVDTIKNTLEEFINTVNTICPNDIIVVILNIGNETKSYSWISDNVKKPCFEDYIKFCLHNHHSNFHGVNIDGITNIFLNKISKEVYNSLELEKIRISSYYYYPIYNRNGESIGTVHTGNFINNYFNNSDIREKLTELFFRSGEIIDNALLFNQEKKNRANTLNVFSKFIPESIINKLLKEGEIDRTGEVKRICILFSDIRSFTSISERNSAENVVSLLNNYFNIMVKCIREQGGIIDKFIGDAIMAIFGAPDEMDDIEKRAVTAAKNMINSLPKVNTEGLTLPPVGFKIGVGLHVGDSIVGNIGSNEKKTYTSIGDTANIAEELEALTKKYKTPILITGDVAKACNSKLVDTIELDNKKIELHSVMEIK